MTVSSFRSKVSKMLMDSVSMKTSLFVRSTLYHDEDCSDVISYYDARISCLLEVLDLLDDVNEID